MALTVEMVTPRKVAFSGTATQVQAPGILGEFGVLEGHARMLAVTKAGIVALHTDDGTRRLLVGPGFAEVGLDQVTLLVDRCEEIDGVDKEQAKRDLDEANAVLGSVDTQSDEGLQAQKRADWAQARLET